MKSFQIKIFLLTIIFCSFVFQKLFPFSETKYELEKPPFANSEGWKIMTLQQASEGKALVSNKQGQSIIIEFTGRSAVIGFWKISAGGIAEIDLDENHIASIDLFSFTVTPVFYEKVIGNNLTAGKHTVKITVSSNKNPSSRDYNVIIDYFRSADSAYTSLSGKVFEHITGYGVPKTIVTLKAKTQTENRKIESITNINGDYLIEGLIPNEYTVSASHYGYIDSVLNAISLKEGLVETIDILLKTKKGIKPLQYIIKPHIGLPQIVKAGETFEIWVKAPKDSANWQCSISNTIVGAIHELPLQFDLPISQPPTFDEKQQIWKLFVTVPQNAPEEIYNLLLTFSNGEDITLNSVKIVKEYKNKFRIVHITDIHIGMFDKNFDTFKNTIEEINLLNPALVITTGDNTDNSGYYNIYDGYSVESKGEWTETGEFLPFIDASSNFRVPFFIVPGNHDVTEYADTLAQNRWTKYFGSRYFSFDYGSYHFSAIDNADLSIPMGGFGGRQPHSQDLEPAQLNWLEEDLKLHQNSTLRFLLFHVAMFGRESKIFELTDKYKVKMGLCGHIHKNEFELKKGQNIDTIFLETCAEFETCYRPVEIENGEILQYSYNNSPSRSLNSGKITIKYSPANDGTSQTVTAEVKNKNTQRFENCMVKFLVPKREKQYSVTGGTIVQIVEGQDIAAIYVEFNLESKSTAIIKVE